MTKTRRRGQALLEWVVFLVPILLFSVASAVFATNLFRSITVQVLAPIAARRALSNAKVIRPEGVTIELQHYSNQARATVSWQNHKASYSIRLPKNIRTDLPRF